LVEIFFEVHLSGDLLFKICQLEFDFLIEFLVLFVGGLLLGESELVRLLSFDDLVDHVVDERARLGFELESF